MQQHLELTLRSIRNINWGCHGIPERCLVIKGKRMQICARCFGCNIGHIISCLLFILGLLPDWYWGIVGFGIMLSDWLLQTHLRIMSKTYRRVATGILGGFGVGVLLWTFITYIAIILWNLI